MANLPPKDVEPSVLFAKLTATPRPYRVVDLPRKNHETGEPVSQVAMVVLTQEEMINAASEAEKLARKKLGEGLPKKEEYSLGYDDVYQNIAACEVLFRACRSVEDITKKAFKTPHEIMQSLSNDEIAVLHHHYLTVKYELGPIVAEMSVEEMETWIRVLGEGGSTFPLDTLSWGVLRTLVVSMAKRLHPSLTDKSSAGSPPDESTPPSDNDEPVW